GGILVMKSRDGLLAIDAYSGKTVWQREDIRSSGDLFGDDEYLAVVERGATGKPSATRVLRVADGGTVKVPDFVAAYDNRLQTLGRTLVLSDKDEDKTITFRRYDVATGKDVWKETYPAGTRPVHSEVGDLYGVVEPEGKVHL